MNSCLIQLYMCPFISEFSCMCVLRGDKNTEPLHWFYKVILNFFLITEVAFLILPRKTTKITLLLILLGKQFYYGAVALPLFTQDKSAKLTFINGGMPCSSFGNKGER